MTKQEVQSFRGDFQKAVAQLEEQYGVNITLGAIRYDVNGLSSKMKAEKGDKVVRATKDDFNVGDIVGINHARVNKNDQFEVIKVNSKTITVEKLNVGNGRIGAQMRVSPSLLFKK